MAAIGYSDVGITVFKTGWSSKGDAGKAGTSVANAAAFNDGLTHRILDGAETLLWPSVAPYVCLFALFNEDKKLGPAFECNYGLFYPNEAKVYDISLVARPTVVLLIFSSPAPLPSLVSTPAPVRKRTWCMAREGVGEINMRLTKTTLIANKFLYSFLCTNRRLTIRPVITNNFLRLF